MRKFNVALLITILIILPGALHSLDRKDFDAIVDFSITIKTLNLHGETDPSFLDTDKLLLLNGTVSSISFVNPKQENFVVQVELVSGEWVGLEEVKSYNCTVIFQGSEFYRLFPRRRPKNPSPDMISANNRVLVVAKAQNRVTNEAGELHWLLEGFYIRRIR